MIDVDGMVGRLVQLVQDAYLAPCLGSSREDGITEMILRDHLRATECEKDATWLNHLHRLHIQTGITLEGVVQGTAVLGKGWRVKDD